MLSFSSSTAMEIPEKKENIPLGIPSTPYECFSSENSPLPDDLKIKYSTQIRIQLMEILRLSDKVVKLKSKEINEFLESLRKCCLICNDWGHPSKEMFSDMKTFMESVDSSSSEK
jgi:hypothetical protein